MIYPTLNELAATRQMVDAFSGYNHNLRIKDGEFYDMENLTSAYYPVLSPRGKRGVFSAPENPQGLIAKDALGYVDGTEFVIGEYRIDMGLSVEPEDCPKQLISMGANVIIMPDRKYINTADLTDYGNIEASFTTAAPVTFTLCKLDGEDYPVNYTQPDAPGEPENMQYWVDTSSTPHALKQWSAASGMWVSVGTTYIKIASPGIGAAFDQYDGVDISGLKDAELIDNATGAVVVDTDIAALDGSMVIWEKKDDYIVVIGLLDVTRTLTNTVTVKRQMPLMDYVVESGNRLFGCRYGLSRKGEVVNEIYVSKLGDFKNWNCFMGIATDSYVASLGTDGRFTGAITHLGYPLFWKENVLHKVYGTMPSDFRIQETACRGVERGSERSLAIVNEVLYYKGRNGICAYDGSLPQEISGQLGEVRYMNAVGGSHGNKYCVSMADSTGAYHLFVYDASKGMWHREDSTQADAWCSCRNEMYYIDHDTKRIMTMLGSGTQETAPVRWMAETGTMETSSPDHKYISRLVIRMSMAIGTRVYFHVQYDSSGDWEYVGTMTGSTLRSFSVPIRPKRCDHLRLRISGEGDAKIYSITKTIEQGSDI